jgi:hypothetical protein
LAINLLQVTSTTLNIHSELLPTARFYVRDGWSGYLLQKVPNAKSFPLSLNLLLFLPLLQ